MTSNEKIKISQSTTQKITSILGYVTWCKPAPGYKKSVLIQLLQNKYMFYYTLFWCLVLFVRTIIGVIRVLSMNLVNVLLVRLLFLSPLLILLQSRKIWVNHLVKGKRRNNKVMFTLYQVVKGSNAEVYQVGLLFTLGTLPSKQSLLLNRTALLAPMLKMERSESDRFLKWSESILNKRKMKASQRKLQRNLILINDLMKASERKLQRSLILINDPFKSKGSIADCMVDNASVHTGNATEQFLHRNRMLVLVHTVPEQLLKRSKVYPVQCEHSLNKTRYDWSNHITWKIQFILTSSSFKNWLEGMLCV